MSLWSTPDWMARSVRNKLLVIGLAPLLVVFPLLALALLVWGNIAYDRLLITKVRADLAVAHGYFEQVMGTVGAGTRGVAGSHALQIILDSPRTEKAREKTAVVGMHDNARQVSAINQLLEAEKQRLGLDFLVLTPHSSASVNLESAFTAGVTSLQPPSHTEPPGLTGAAKLVVLHGEALRQLAPHLMHRLQIQLVPTRNAAPSHRQNEDRAMVMLASYPVLNDQGRQLGTLQGGLLLNQNLQFIDHINRLVYPEGSLPFGSQGTATLFLDDVRITTNVQLFQGERAIGTRVSQMVRDSVLSKGQTWLDRAFVVNDWYVSAYQPLQDAHGERIGMLYVGYLEQPFRWARHGMLAIMGLIVVAVMALAAYFSVRWARTLFKPVEQMNRTMQRVEQGNHEARVGPVAATDEIGALAKHLDHLLDALDENARRLRDRGENLDALVRARTRELESTNASLRQTQQQLVKSEKLAAIGQLTASIAHEINNPIAVIQGNLDLMRETLGPQTRLVNGEFRLLDEQVERMRLIVTQLLQHARPTEFAGYVEALDVNQTLSACLVLVAHLLSKHHITVGRDEHATALVACNHQELQQVVINLLINAIQSMPDGGEIRLSTRDWVDAQQQIQGAVIEIQDEGPGLPPGTMAQMFNPFFTTKNDGNGLGLWISQELVERYGGQLEGDNRTDRSGAIFRVRLLTEPRIPERVGVDTGNSSPVRLA